MYLSADDQVNPGWAEGSLSDGKNDGGGSCAVLMKPEQRGRNGTSLAEPRRRHSLGIWAARISSMSKQNGCLPLCTSPDTFHLTEAHARTQTLGHDARASAPVPSAFT